MKRGHPKGQTWRRRVVLPGRGGGGRTCRPWSHFLLWRAQYAPSSTTFVHHTCQPQLAGVCCLHPSRSGFNSPLHWGIFRMPPVGCPHSQSFPVGTKCRVVNQRLVVASANITLVCHSVLLTLLLVVNGLLCTIIINTQSLLVNAQQHTARLASIGSNIHLFCHCNPTSN